MSPGWPSTALAKAVSEGSPKSDPKDAGIIADQVRHRRDLRAIDAPSEIDAEIRLLVGRRRELVTGQTRRATRLRDLLAGTFAGLSASSNPRRKQACGCPAAT